MDVRVGSETTLVARSSPLSAAAHACSDGSVVAEEVAAAFIRYIRLNEIIDSRPMITSTPTSAMARLCL